MFTIRLRFIAPKMQRTHEDLLKDGEKAFNCPRCGRSMTYFRMPPKTCEDYKCRAKLPDVEMLSDIEKRMYYHYNLENVASFEEIQELIWTQIPGMYSRL